MIKTCSPDDPTFALLDNTRDPDALAHLFTQPQAHVLCREPKQLQDALAALEALKRQGHALCGYLSYEAGYFLVDKAEFLLRHVSEHNQPLVHFYAFAKHERLTQAEVQAFLASQQRASQPVAIADLQLGMTASEHQQAVQAIQAEIALGNSYQVNLTTQYTFELWGSAVALYQKLRQRQSVAYGALLNFPEASVLSLSPELFVRKQGTLVQAKPMKGTLGRGANAAEDAERIAAMQADPKTLSENVMIVDLIRNDLSRIAKPGQVWAENLFEVQTFETLHQMISTVNAEVPADLSVTQLFQGLFPCGSITGAPKISTMQIIERLEKAPRGLYTGAIGYLTPESDFCFNVPIRTCVVQKDGQAELGVGGGILHESDPAAEFEECLLKAKFLTQINQDLTLIESLRFEQGLPNLPAHLQRLQASAQTLGFALNVEAITQALHQTCAPLQGVHKVRLELAWDGSFAIQTSVIDMPSQQPLLLGLCPQKVQASQLLQHKTNQRACYQQALQTAQASGCAEVLFLNQAGQVTEASYHNFFMRLDGIWHTAPVTDGLLPGVARQALLDDPSVPTQVRSLSPQDLLQAEALWLTNAVRGRVPAVLCETAKQQLACWAKPLEVV
jgi:para-aminobenzoate synthetase/4-amino-4-deoxychorismate lyase